MEKIKLALIGKNIQNSQSPVLYKSFLGDRVVYDLIDIADETQMPSLESLSKTYQGLNITAPYKKYYLKDVSIEGDYQMAINTISLSKDGNHSATNTDYLALRQILSSRFSIKKNILVLGDGAMSELITSLIGNVEVYSRKNNKLKDVVKLNEKYDLVINTCLKEYDFKTTTPSMIEMFWSLNYGNSKEENYCKENKIAFESGIELLELQAKYALQFWKLNDNSVT